MDEAYCEPHGAVLAPSREPALVYDFVEFCGGAGVVTQWLSRRGALCAPPIGSDLPLEMISLQVATWSAVWLH